MGFSFPNLTSAGGECGDVRGLCVTEKWVDIIKSEPVVLFSEDSLLLLQVKWKSPNETRQNPMSSQDDVSSRDCVGFLWFISCFLSLLSLSLE